MISTLCIGGVRAGLLGEGLFALILRWTCPYADAPARHSGAMFIVSTSGPHSVTLFCSLKTFSIGGWAENGSHHLSSHGSESSPRKPSLKSKQSPSCFPDSITFMPSPCLCPSCFISGSQLGFKSPNFRFSCNVDWCWSQDPGRVFLCFCHLLACSRNVVAWLQNSSVFMARWSRVPAPRLAVLSQSLHSYAWKQCSMLALPILLATQVIFRSCCPLLGLSPPSPHL